MISLMYTVQNVTSLHTLISIQNSEVQHMSLSYSYFQIANFHDEQDVFVKHKYPR